jgi:hypothetical protein
VNSLNVVFREKPTDFDSGIWLIVVTWLPLLAFLSVLEAFVMGQACA